MLPNHAPLMVAERFKMLEALFPGRIDLGLGRAPGTDGATAYAAQQANAEGDDFLERLHELTLWETRDFPPAIPITMWWRCRRFAAAADLAARLQRLFFELAAQVGMGFAFAHHFLRPMTPSTR